MHKEKGGYLLIGLKEEVKGSTYIIRYNQIAQVFFFFFQERVRDLSGDIDDGVPIVIGLTNLFLSENETAPFQKTTSTTSIIELRISKL